MLLLRPGRRERLVRASLAQPPNRGVALAGVRRGRFSRCPVPAVRSSFGPPSLLRAWRSTAAAPATRPVSPARCARAVHPSAQSAAGSRSVGTGRMRDRYRNTGPVRVFVFRPVSGAQTAGRGERYLSRYPVQIRFSALVRGLLQTERLMRWDLQSVRTGWRFHRAGSRLCRRRFVSRRARRRAM